MRYTLGSPWTRLCFRNHPAILQRGTFVGGGWESQTLAYGEDVCKKRVEHISDISVEAESTA
jgi:hypothetical protein